MTKQWLIEEFCPLERYHCLMPVEYESIEQDGVILEYRKTGMACRNARNGSCKQIAECPFFRIAPEHMEKNVNWYEP